VANPVHASPRLCVFVRFEQGVVHIFRRVVSPVRRPKSSLGARDRLEGLRDGRDALTNPGALALDLLDSSSKAFEERSAPDPGGLVRRRAAPSAPSPCLSAVASWGVLLSPTDEGVLPPPSRDAIPSSAHDVRSVGETASSSSARSCCPSFPAAHRSGVRDVMLTAARGLWRRRDDRPLGQLLAVLEKLDLRRSPRP